jgi:tetratricopeptide (TPR) repeat protein
MGKGKGYTGKSRGLPVNNQQRALDLCRRAELESDPDRACMLAAQAMECWPDCAEAYIILARFTAEDDYQAAGMYSQAYNAGVSALGGLDLAKHANILWQDELGRSCIRALSQFARSIVDLTLYTDASLKFTLAQVLDEEDNLGNRYYSIACLVAIGDYEEAFEMLEGWDDPKDRLVSLGWLLANVHSGRRGEAEKELALQILEADRDLLQWMVDPLTVESAIHLEYCNGDVEEVERLLGLFSEVWWMQPDAVEWLREVTGLDPPRKFNSDDLDLPLDMLQKLGL